jgi:hypothetical protein
MDKNIVGGGFPLIKLKKKINNKERSFSSSINIQDILNIKKKIEKNKDTELETIDSL